MLLLILATSRGYAKNVGKLRSLRSVQGLFAHVSSFIYNLHMDVLNEPKCCLYLQSFFKKSHVFTNENAYSFESELHLLPVRFSVTKAKGQILQFSCQSQSR